MDIKAQKRTDKRSSMDMCLSYKVNNVKSMRYNIGHPVLFLFCYSSAAFVVTQPKILINRIVSTVKLVNAT
jgi:hypothetical protein